MNSLRTSFLSTAYYKLLNRWLLPRLDARNMTPNQLTWLGALVSIVVPLGFWVHPLWGFTLILISGVADSVDGLMARQQFKTSRWGAFLDSTLDRVSDFFYLLGFWMVFYWTNASKIATLGIFAAILLTFLISYSKARAEALGYSCPVGLMERGVRVASLLIWALALAVLPANCHVILWLGLGLYNALALATVLQRGIFIKRLMANPPDSSCNGIKNQHI